MRRNTSWVILAAFANCLLAAGCGNKSAASSAAPEAIPVKIEVARAVSVPETTEYLAVMKSRHSAAINPQVDGQITQIFVKSGDHVALGTPLLQIDPLKQEATVGSQEAARAAQEANLRLAKTDLDRAQKLFDAGVISRQWLDSAQSNYDSASARLNSLVAQVQQQKVELQYYRVVAPMDGIVGDIPVHVGDRVTTSALLTTVNELGGLEAYVYVPVGRSKDLRVGLSVHLLGEDGKPLAESRITFVSPQAENDTQTILAKAAVENARGSFRLAQQARAQIVWGTRLGPVIPILAVTRISGEFFAFVVANDGKGTVARQKHLRIGETVGNDYAILDGLAPGDHIIVSGAQFLADGVPVKEETQQPGAAAAR